MILSCGCTEENGSITALCEDAMVLAGIDSERGVPAPRETMEDQHDRQELWTDQLD
jgi:hypothetical protein